MSKAVLVRGAFALQCRLSVPPVTVAVSRCTHCSTHYRTPIVKYGTVQKSNLAKWRQDDVCCRRAIRRWKAETVALPEMCGTPAAEQKKFIHTSVEDKCTVSDTVPVLPRACLSFDCCAALPQAASSHSTFHYSSDANPSSSF